MRLAVEGLGFGYRGKPVGRDVSLAVEPGEVLCLLGPNGSGKTTLFKTILGLLPAQAGRVVIGEAELARLSRRDAARILGYVPQAHGGYFPFTARDVVLMGRAAHLGPFAMPGRRDVEIAERALETLGIPRLADAIYTAISGGERQLVLIARALAQEPRILVMDEPTANLDFGNQLRVLDQVAALARAGMSVILSTHDPDHAFAVATRVAMIRDGHLLRLGPPAETVTAANLKLLYGVEVEIVTVDHLRGPDGAPARACLPSLGGRDLRAS